MDARSHRYGTRPADEHIFSLELVRVNASGRDLEGTFWGTESPVYRAHNETLTKAVKFKAADRATAKAYIMAKVDPDAQFYK